MRQNYSLMSKKGNFNTRSQRHFWDKSRKYFGRLLNTRLARRDLREDELSLAQNLDMLGSTLVMRKGSIDFGLNTVNDFFTGDIELVSSFHQVEPDNNSVIFFHIRETSTGDEGLFYMAQDENYEIRKFYDFKPDGVTAVPTRGKSDFVSRPDNEVYFVCQPSDVNELGVCNRVLMKSLGGPVFWTSVQMGIEGDETVKPSFKVTANLKIENLVGTLDIGEQIVGNQSGAVATIGAFLPSGTNGVLEIFRTTDQNFVNGETITRTTGAGTGTADIIRFSSVVQGGVSAPWDAAVDDKLSGASSGALALNIFALIASSTIVGDKESNEPFQVGETITNLTNLDSRTITNISAQDFVFGTVGYVVTRIRKTEAGDPAIQADDIVHSESSPTDPVYIDIAPWGANSDGDFFLPSGQIELDLTAIAAIDADPQVTHFRIYRTQNLKTVTGVNDLDLQPTDRNLFLFLEDVLISQTAYIDNNPDTFLNSVLFNETRNHCPLPNAHSAVSSGAFVVVSNDSDVYASGNNGLGKPAFFQSFPKVKDSRTYNLSDGGEVVYKPRGGRFGFFKSDGFKVVTLVNIEDDVMVWKENNHGYVPGSNTDIAASGIVMADDGPGEEVLGTFSAESPVARNKKILLRTNRGIRFGDIVNFSEDISEVVLDIEQRFTGKEFGVFFNDKYMLFGENFALVLRFDDFSRAGSFQSMQGWIEWVLPCTYVGPIIIENNKRLIAFCNDTKRWYELEKEFKDQATTIQGFSSDFSLDFSIGSSDGSKYTSRWRTAPYKPRRTHLQTIELVNSMSVYAGLTTNLTVQAQQNYDENFGSFLRSWDALAVPADQIGNRDVYDVFFKPINPSNDAAPRRVFGDILEFEFSTTNTFIFFGLDVSFLEHRKPMQSREMFPELIEGVIDQDTYEILGNPIETDTYEGANNPEDQDVFGVPC